MKTSTQLKALIRNLSRDKGINAEIIEGGYSMDFGLYEKLSDR